MPRLSTSGSAVMGIAGITMSIDGATPAALAGTQSGNWDWMSTTRLAGFADFGAGPHFFTYNLVGPVLTQVDPKNATFSAAGGNVWAAFLADGVTGVYWSIAGPVPSGFPLAGLADVSPTGITTIVQHFSNDSGLAAYDSTGALLWTLAVQVFPSNASPISIRDNVLAFRTKGDLLYNLYNATTLSSLSWTRRTGNSVVKLIPITVGGVVYVLENDGTNITLRLANSQQGYQITDQATAFGIDGIFLTGSTVRVAWSTNSGESAAALVVADIDLATGNWTKATVSGGVLVPVAQTPLSLIPMPGTAVGGQAGGLDMVARHSMTDDHGIVTPEWLRYFRRMERFATALPNLGNATGSLPPSQGGTGGTGGLSPLDGHNLNDGSVPLNKLETQPWRWIEPGGFEDGGGTGDDGAPGAQGPPGPTGAAGTVGPLGGAWDGEPGDDGWPVPGTAGAAGSPGAAGAVGPLGGAWEGEPGDDGWPVPGPAGAAGSAGAAGTIGRDGAPGQEGNDGEDGYIVQGATGATGAAGSIGSMGDEGLPGDDGWPGLQGIQGPTGPAGADGLQPEALLALQGRTMQRVWFLEQALGASYPVASLSGPNVPSEAELIALEEIDLLEDVMNVTVVQRLRTFGITIDGGGSVITTGTKGYVQVPYGGTIVSWTLLATDGLTGSIVIDIYKNTYALFPPTVANTITGSAKPTISAATKATSSTLTGWNPIVNAGDVFGFNVDSVSTLTRATLEVVALVT